MNGYVLPFILAPHPREFEGFVYLVAHVYGIPVVAIIGLTVGVMVGSWLDKRKKSD